MMGEKAALGSIIEENPGIFFDKMSFLNTVVMFQVSTKADSIVSYAEREQFQSLRTKLSFGYPPVRCTCVSPVTAPPACVLVFA
jgi:hypothetical protein